VSGDAGEIGEIVFARGSASVDFEARSVVVKEVTIFCFFHVVCLFVVVD